MVGIPFSSKIIFVSGISKLILPSFSLLFFNTFGIILNNVEEKAEKLWHAISGATFVRYILNIQDEQIIDAIRYHTTAKADMPLLSKILYLADFTSRDRDYEDVDVIRVVTPETFIKDQIDDSAEFDFE